VIARQPFLQGIVYEKANGKHVTQMTQIAETEQTERAKVQSWRLHVLIEAGYPLPLAEKLADSEADLHRAVELVGSGCRHETAARILL
jgi:hypothetical protein